MGTVTGNVDMVNDREPNVMLVKYYAEDNAGSASKKTIKKTPRTMVDCGTW